jgi:hypothetical protein
MRCPNGTRKNKQGDCVKTMTKLVKPGPAKLKRCPNGTRKNKKGDCEPTSVKPEPIPKRCPNGTKKNKQGVCVSKLTKIATPRTKYSCRYFKKPIQMSKNELFQIHFDKPDQFKKYVNLSKAPTLDCGYQSLFALGLLEVEHAKKSAEEVNRKGKFGIFTDELRTFFRINFGFTSKESIEAYNTNDAKNFLEALLENNYATILLLEFEKNGHYIVSYKWKNKVYFYDPQQNKHIKVDKKNKFHFFKVKVDGPKVFTSIQKSLPFVG